MNLRDRVDPQSLPPLDAQLAEFPGGLNAIAELAERRRAYEALCARLTAEAGGNDRVHREDRTVPGPAGAFEVPVRIYRSPATASPSCAIFFIHGGGMVRGSIDAEDLTAAALCEELGALVISVGYRLAPEHPYPAPVEDCYAALVWVASNRPALGAAGRPLILYGGSAGGGLVIATSLLARDRGGPPIDLQMALYPMLDDRNVTASSHEITDLGLWDRAASIEAWAWYLGGRPADEYAAPTRAADLRGLPATFIDVGDVDLFRDEDIEFATRLMQAGVPTELHVYPGAYHASEGVAPEADLSQRIWAARFAALRAVLR